MNDATAYTIRFLLDMMALSSRKTRTAWKGVFHDMQMSPPAFAIASSAAVIFLAACPGNADRHDQAAILTASVESRLEPEGPALAEQRRLVGELASLEKQQASLVQSFSEKETEIARSERGLRDLKLDLEQQKAETNLYIDQHEVQVACAFADGIARGEGEYSEKTKECAKVASFYCALAMISGSFRQKVAAAKQYVDEAETRAQSLKMRITEREDELATQRAKLRATQDEIDRTAFQIAAVRQHLTGLGDGLQPILPRAPKASDPKTPSSVE